MIRSLRRWLVPAAAIGLATTGFAYLAGNTVDASNAGLGTGTITGYTVTNITYTTNTMATQAGSDWHHYISGVTFTLTSTAGTGTAPSNVWAEVQHGSTTSQFGKCTGSWTTSGAGGSGSYSCQANDTIPLHDADQLSVLAYQ